MKPATGEVIPVIVELQVFSDITTVTAGDDARRYTITADEDGSWLRSVHGKVTTVSSSGIVRFQIHNLTTATDVLSTRTSIDASETTSWTAATPHVVNPSPAVGQMTLGHVLRVDADDAGTGAKGLVVVFEFGPGVLLA